MTIRERLRSYALKQEDMNVETEYLIPDFLPKQMISVWYADGGAGKSYLAYGTAMRILVESACEVVYMDWDNPLSTLKNRGLDKKLLGVHRRLHYLHRSNMDLGAEELICAMGADAHGKMYKDLVLIVDSLKDLVSDVGNDVRVARVMNHLMNIREAGATVLLLHHTNKDGKNYQGSNQIRNSIDVMYRLHQKPSTEGTINYWCEVEKERAGVLDRAWSLDVASLALTELDSDVAQMSAYEQEFTAAVCEVLKSGEMNKTEILNAVGFEKTDKTARAALDKFDGKLYMSEERTRNRAKARIYFLNPTTTTTTTITPKTRASPLTDAGAGEEDW